MIERDLFVGIVAIAAGVFVVAGGATGHERFMQAMMPQLLVYRFGAIVARSIVIVVGVAFLTLGLFILRGEYLAESGRGDPADLIRSGKPAFAVAGWSRCDEPEC